MYISINSTRKVSSNQFHSVFIYYLTLEKKATAVHGAWAVAKKSFKLVWQFHQLLSGFLVKGPLTRVPRQSHLSTNDKGDNEMIPGSEHRSPSIHLIAEGNLLLA